jgi:TolB-like protein
MAQVVQFEDFTVDLRAGEIHRRGCKIKLQEKPFQILGLLLDRPGEVVTREELRAKLWPQGVFVDFDHSLKTALSKLRNALGDDARHPRFVETLPRRGYRFLAPVERSTGYSLIPRWLQSDRVIVAVLPFEDYSPGQHPGHLAESITEELTTWLGGLNPRRIGVLARHSVLRFQGGAAAIESIAQALHVSYLIAGTVRCAGGRARVTAQLIRASDQTHAWAASYEQAVDDILTLAAQVAESIAKEIVIRLIPIEIYTDTRRWGTWDRSDTLHEPAQTSYKA